MMRRSSTIAASASFAVKYRHAIATRTAVIVSPALPAAVKKRARRLPGSLNAASPRLRAI